MPGLVAPAALALLPLLGLVAAMYMLRLRREDHRVPSTLLWRAVVQDPPANAPWRRLRVTPLLVLQLLFLALLIGALARPFLPTDHLVGQNLVVLLDRSASMAATDVSPSRLESAKRELLELVDTAAGARFTLIAFDDDMTVLAASQSDPAAVKRAVADVEVVPTDGDITDALTFASALAEGMEDAQVVVLSDGNFDIASGTVVAAPVRYVPIGESGDNQAVTAVSITDRAGGGPPELFVQVANFAREPALRRVQVLVDGTLYDARDLAMPARGREAFGLALPADFGSVEARLVGEDALPLDDAAWAVRPHASLARVTIVSAGNRFLETALSLLPTVESVTHVPPDEADGPYGLTDVTVLDGLVPERLPPGNLLVVGPVTSTVGVSHVGELTNPVPRVVDPEHPLAAGMELDQMSILTAAALELGPAWTPVVVADIDGRAWPLVAQGSIAGAEAVVVAFDVRQSDLPLRPAFPLLMAAAIDALAPATLAGVPAMVPPGEAVELKLSPGVSTVRIVAPDGSRHEPAVEGGTAHFGATEQLGVYVVEVEAEDGAQDVAQDGAQTAMFTVNLAASAEHDVEPVDDVRFEVAAGETASAARTQGRRELWWAFGLVGLGLLLAEWGYYHRRALGQAPWRRAVRRP